MYARRLLVLLALVVAGPALAGCGDENLATASIAQAAEVTSPNAGCGSRSTRR